MIRKLAFMLLLIAIASQVSAQNYKFQSLFIYNIVKRINWPPGSNDFVIGVVGSKDLVKELVNLSQKQKLGNKTIKVKSVHASNDSFEGIHVLYLGRSSSSKIDVVKSRIASKPVLLIGDKSGLKGAGINFIDNSKSIEFEIYPTTIKEHHLTVASSLLSLGIVKE